MVKAMSFTRRIFLRNSLLTGAALRLPHTLRAQHSEQAIRRVLVMFKCHFDAGFINTQAEVVGMYFHKYFPEAMSIAAASREQGSDRYIWTTGSWLVYKYLEQAGPAERRRMEQALVAGDLAWHGLPFSWQTEMLDPSMIRGAVGLSQTLDRRFGKTTTGSKMTDVPGHTRGLITPLIESGITFLDIGVNAASTPPQVPSIFNWYDGRNSLTVMYHRHDYGGLVVIPGSDLAVDIEVRTDNSGPHTPAEIAAIYAKLRRRFPNSQVSAASLTEIANAVVPLRANLLHVTQEIGDTWIYGVPSDPIKVARYRETMRLRSEWLERRKFAEADATDRALLEWLLLEPEHTWGTDTKTWLDFDHYTPAGLASVISKPNYQTVEYSWKEKRKDLFTGIRTLPKPLRREAGARLAALKPVAPSIAALRSHRPQQVLSGAHFEVALDPATGAIHTLLEKSTGRDLASPDHPLALFTYQTLSQVDYDRFFRAYLQTTADWAPKDFGKPNIARFGAESREWHPRLVNAWSEETADKQRIVAELAVADAVAQAGGRVAWPGRIFLEIRLPCQEPVLEIALSWFGKQANRLPEALWLTFLPITAPDGQWTLEKSGQKVSPLGVVEGGNRHMHALTGPVEYTSPGAGFVLESIDAPVVALGERHPVYFCNEQPDLTRGLHFSLYNNGWGTNYIQWFGEDARFRFRLAGANLAKTAQ
jgi:hypothetical protein